MDHPEHGELSPCGRCRPGALGYSTLGGAANKLGRAGVPREEQISLNGSTLAICVSGAENRATLGKATFLIRKGVNLLLMSSTRPQAKELRDWLARSSCRLVLTSGTSFGSGEIPPLKGEARPYG